MYITVEEIKKHLNIDSYFTDDDEYLVSLIEVAEKVVQAHIDCSFNDLLDDDGKLPTPIIQAMKLFIGNMYQSRESVAFVNATEIPFAYDYLLSLYKDYSKKNKEGGIFG